MELENVAEIEVELQESGPAGEQGPPGLSAYEVYLVNGGTLSEKEWLESLKGETGTTGADGKDGVDGKDGYTPVKGVDYFTEEDIASLNIPTKTSQLENDSDFITSEYVNEAIASIDISKEVYTLELSGNYDPKNQFNTTDDDKVRISELITLLKDDANVPIYVKTGNGYGMLFTPNYNINSGQQTSYGYQFLKYNNTNITTYYLCYFGIHGSWNNDVFTCTDAFISTISEYYLSTGTANSSYTPTKSYHPATKKYVDDSVATLGDYVDEQLVNAGGMSEEQIIEMLQTKGFIIIDQDMKGCDWSVANVTNGKAPSIRSREYNTDAYNDFMTRLNTTMNDLKTKGYTDAEIRQRLVIVLRNVYYSGYDLTISGTFVAFSDYTTSTGGNTLRLTGDLKYCKISNNTKKYTAMCYPEITLYYGGDYFNDTIFDINLKYIYLDEEVKNVARQYDFYENKLDFSKYTYQYIVDNNVNDETSEYYAAPIDNVTFGQALYLEVFLLNGFTGSDETGLNIFVSRENATTPSGFYLDYKEICKTGSSATKNFFAISASTTALYIGFSKTTTEAQYNMFRENSQLMLTVGTTAVDRYKPYQEEGPVATKKYVDEQLANIDAPDIDLSEYATTSYVDENSVPIYLFTNTDGLPNITESSPTLGIIIGDAIRDVIKNAYDKGIAKFIIKMYYAKSTVTNFYGRCIELYFTISGTTITLVNRYVMSPYSGGYTRYLVTNNIRVVDGEIKGDSSNKLFVIKYLGDYKDVSGAIVTEDYVNNAVLGAKGSQIYQLNLTDSVSTSGRYLTTAELSAFQTICNEVLASNDSKAQLKLYLKGNKCVGFMEPSIEYTTATTFYDVIKSSQKKLQGKLACTTPPANTSYAFIDATFNITGTYNSTSNTISVTNVHVQINLNNHVYNVMAMSSFVKGSDVLKKTNTTSFTPTGDYHPATKKYVDDAIASSITSVLEGEY